MSKERITGYSSIILLATYLLFIVHFLLALILPDLYPGSSPAAIINRVYSLAGGVVFVLVFILLLLHITGVLKIKQKGFGVLSALILVHLFLVYLDISKQGDS